jgi:hypothetical protein
MSSAIENYSAEPRIVTIESIVEVHRGFCRKESRVMVAKNSTIESSELACTTAYRKYLISVFTHLRQVLEHFLHVALPKTNASLAEPNTIKAPLAEPVIGGPLSNIQSLCQFANRQQFLHIGGASHKTVKTTKPNGNHVDKLLARL